MSINPNSDRDFIDKADINDEKCFPKFIKSIELKPFRHIDELKINLQHPISIITGTNRSGKSTILMAIACSHYDFQKRNPRNGKIERHTWGSLMKFTNKDVQKEDWTYFIEYKTGKKIEPKRGQRKFATKKWNGVAKKESQIKDRRVVFLDMDRIIPARYFNNKMVTLSNSGMEYEFSGTIKGELEMFVAYIFETEVQLVKIAEHLDKEVFSYNTENQYTSYNTASGEDTITKLLIDILESPKNSLILIDEVELGLHPKVQRRLIDTLYVISKKDSKQFILTTHSPSIISSVPEISRVFVERNYDGSFKSIPKISVNAALSKMDSVSYPLLDIYCEDDVSKKIIGLMIEDIQRENGINGLTRLVNIIESGSSDITYQNFVSHKRTYRYKYICSGYACVLDGDMKTKKSKEGKSLFPEDEFLFFLMNDCAPEKFLLEAYLFYNNNDTLRYHLNKSDPHCLLNKLVENTGLNTSNVIEECYKYLMKTHKGVKFREEFSLFLIRVMKCFSKDL